MSKTQNRRKKKLVRVDLQLKIVFITLFVASLILLINFQLNLAGLWSFDARTPSSEEGEALLQAFRTATIQKFLLSVGLAVPLAAAVGILYSFKFCGPIFRFKTYLGSLVTGRWDEKCFLRKGDELQDVCDTINRAVDTFRNQARRSHAFYQEVKTFLDSNASLLEGDETREHVEALRAEIESESERFFSRFKGDSPSADAAGDDRAEGSPVEAEGSSDVDCEPESRSAEDGGVVEESAEEPAVVERLA